jgi:hypothetical protein
MISLNTKQLLNTAEGPALAKLLKADLPAAARFRVKALYLAMLPKVQAATEARGALFTASNSIEVPAGRQIKPECLAAYFEDPFFLVTVNIDAAPLKNSDLEAAVMSVADELSLAAVMEVSQ